MGYKVRNDGKLEKTLITQNIGYNPKLFSEAVEKFTNLIKILIPNVQINSQYVDPHVYEKYVKQHIENHNVVPDLYLQYIIDMPWEQFVVEYLRDAVQIANQICEQIKQEETRSQEETRTQEETEKPRRKKDDKELSNISLRAENKRLKAVIEAQNLLNDIISGKKRITKIDSLMTKIKNAGNPIMPLKEKESAPVKVKDSNHLLEAQKGRKPTVKQTIKQAYEHSNKWEDFLTTFDSKFIIANMDEIKKFVKALYGADKINDEELERFNYLWNKLCPYGDFSSKEYGKMIQMADSSQEHTL